jgi:hypothetical protein
MVLSTLQAGGMRHFKRSARESVTVEGTGKAMTKGGVGECFMPGIEPG